MIQPVHQPDTFTDALRSHRQTEQAHRRAVPVVALGPDSCRRMDDTVSISDEALRQARAAGELHRARDIRLNVHRSPRWALVLLAVASLSLAAAAMLLAVLVTFAN